MARNICAMYGDNAIKENMTRKRFSRLKEDRFDISETPCSGRPSGFHEDQLNALNHKDPRQCTWELANVMNCDHSTIIQCLYSMGKVQKSGVWVPHALSQNHRNQQVAIFAYLPARHWLTHEQHWPFLYCIVTGDEKWCLYAIIFFTRLTSWESVCKIIARRRKISPLYPLHPSLALSHSFSRHWGIYLEQRYYLFI